jgi:O-antigen/teichoic acid export membrane protein
VVLIISSGTLYNMATGLNAPILFNSDRYRYGAVFLVLLAVIVLALQYFLIPLYGLEGAASATALASFIYNTMLMLTVWKFYGLNPFDMNNLKLLVVFLVCLTAMFLMPTFDDPILSMVMNSTAGIAPELRQQLMEWKSGSK